MVVGNLSWDSAKLGILSHTSPVLSVKLSEQQVFHDEGVRKMVYLPTGERLTQDGYRTNAPSELTDKDFVHSLIYSSSVTDEEATEVGKAPKRIEWDTRWGGEVCTTQGSHNFGNMTSQRIKDKYITGKDSLNEGCLNSDAGKDTKHYWIDKTQGPHSIGCGNDEADNYTTEDDYRDDSLCTYSCSDPNRNTTAEGKCGTTCVDGYGFDNDGVCQEGISARFVGGIKNLPWMWIGGVFVLIIAGKIWMKRRK